jgi:hypothetical protein
MTKQKGEQKIVSWFFPKKALIKFEGAEDSVPVADNVMEVSNFDKYPILKGDTVEVTVKDDEVIFLRKVAGAKKNTAKKSATKTETKSSDGNKEVKTVTIFAVAKSKEVVKFDKEGAWIKVSAELQTQDFTAIGLVARNEVEVTLQDDMIVDVGVNKAEKSESKSTVSESKSSSSYNGTASSIERQCALKGAVEIVKSLLELKEIQKSNVKEVIADLTTACYNAIQNA